MVKNHNLAKAISEMGWRQLRTMLEYKSAWQGKNLIVIGRFEPSSKVCSNCGNHKKDLKLSDRTYRCDKCSNSIRSEEHTSELQSRENLVCRLLLEKKKKKQKTKKRVKKHQKIKKYNPPEYDP